jgi:arylsulfatase A-like enzyme
MAAGITDRQRATFGAMVGAFDDAVGNISLALDEVGFGGNTLIVFTTDNGGPQEHFDGHGPSNFPLRAGKSANFEGGVRGASFIAGSAVPSAVRGTRSMSLMHCADWFPTFAGLAGAMLTPKQKQALDGFDMWPAITGVVPQSPRTEILHNIDPITGYAAIRVGKYKYLASNDQEWGADPRIFSSLPAGKCLYEDICPKGLEVGVEKQEEHESNNVGGHLEYLFNMDVDPQERVNLIDSTASEDVEAFAQIMRRLEHYRASMVPLRNLEPDEAAVPEVVPGLNICTPSPRGPILCQDIGIWRPWQPDPEDSFTRTLVV